MRRQAENMLWEFFEDFVIDESLESFTNHAGIMVANIPLAGVWDVFRQHYKGREGIDISKFLIDFETWGPIASRIAELKLEQHAAADPS